MEIEAQRYWMTVLQSYTTSKWLGHESISSCVWLQPRWFPIICTFLTFWYFRNKIHTFLLVSFRLGRDQIANILWIMEKAREFQKNIYFCFIDYAKAFDCVDHNQLWEILKEIGIPDHLTCLLRNLYAGQEATVRTGHGTIDWFQIGKGVR